MLVLTQHDGNEIVVIDKKTRRKIGSVFLCESRRDKAKIGFEFDSQYVILRKELADENERLRGSILSIPAPDPNAEKGSKTP